MEIQSPTPASFDALITWEPVFLSTPGDPAVVAVVQHSHYSVDISCSEHGAIHAFSGLDLALATATLHLRIHHNGLHVNPDVAAAVAEDEAIERANLGEHGMAQVPDPCCCRIHAGAGNRCPDCPQHSGE